MPHPSPRALRIVRLGLRVADLAAANAFYVDDLGFRVVAEPNADGGRVLRLGTGEIELRAAAPGAAPYPEPRAANDPWFQHFAIAVGEMSAAYDHLRGAPATPISTDGPQLLPPGAGSVTAWKFRDPDGHPLELSHIPDSAWARATAKAGPFLGIDHTALAVRGLQPSLDFYTGLLGFMAGPRSLNQGPEQDRLDGLADVRVEIAVLETAEAGPHIELLRYRAPRPADETLVRPGDIAATRTVIEVDDLAAVLARFADAHWPHSWVGGALLTQDLDGHWLEVRGAQGRA